MKEMKINKCGCGGEAKIVQIETSHYCRCVCCANRSELMANKNLAIKSWNTAHPEISNAMQAVRWLEEGKKITPIKSNGDFFLVKVDNNFIQSYVMSSGRLEYESVHCFTLLDYDWKLYEEPKFILGTFKEAREHLKAGKRASIIHSQEKIEFDLVRQKYGNYFLCNEEKQYAFQLQDVDFDSCAWRLYEA